jgi:23S rRNA (uracil1939-C5)-methyltransferase
VGQAPVDASVQPTVELTVERLGLEGEGIATHAGRALFVSGALPGERVRVRLEPAGKVCRGRLEQVLSPSPLRRTPPCPLADRCGGCDWMHLEPGAQVAEKQRLVLDALVHLGGFAPGSWSQLPTVGTGTDTGTRRRAVLHWESKWLGYFGRRSHQAIRVDVCPALVPRLASLPGQLSAQLKPLGRSLKAVHLLAEGEAVSLGLDLEGKVRPKTRDVAEALVRTGLVRGVVLLEAGGRTEEVGRPVVEAPAPGRPAVRLRFRADAFAQAQARGVDVLVERAMELLSAKPTDRALELYAGNGTFTFALSGRVASVVAVESSAISLSLGTAAGRAGNVENVRWVQGDAVRVCQGLLKEGSRFDVLLADPPRTGAPKLSEFARALGVRRVVYVGCDAGSLARDAGRLVAAGFRLQTVQLVDVFPNTHHIEALLVFDA